MSAKKAAESALKLDSFNLISSPMLSFRTDFAGTNLIVLSAASLLSPFISELHNITTFSPHVKDCRASVPSPASDEDDITPTYEFYSVYRNTTRTYVGFRHRTRKRQGGRPQRTRSAQSIHPASRDPPTLVSQQKKASAL